MKATISFDATDQSDKWQTSSSPVFWSAAWGGVMGAAVFQETLDKAGGGRESTKEHNSIRSPCFRVQNKLVAYCSSLCTTPPPHTHIYIPHHPDSWKQNSSDSFRCYTHTDTHPRKRTYTSTTGPPHCRNRICRNHSKARYNLLLAVHNTPTHSRPLFSIAQGALRMN